jgi:23S rRNA (uracil1939-C5)-methyltransferase
VPAQNVSLHIERLSKSGDGVAQLGERTVFVEGALPGETVFAEVREEGRVLRGNVLAVQTPAPARREPPCPHAGTCGGCDWQHVEETVQREQKQEIVVSALEHLGGVTKDQYELLPTVSGPVALGYRRRAVLHRAGEGLGFFGKRSHDRVAVEHCLAMTTGLEALPGKLVPALKTVLKELDEVRLLEEGGKTAVSLHLNGAVKEKHRTAAKAVQKLGIRGVVLVPDKGARELIGEPVLNDPGGSRLRPDAFAQANSAVNAELVKAAVAATGQGDVLELYSGNGNFTLSLAARAKSVLAVESDAISLELARESARKRELKNVRFVLGDAEKVARGLGKEGQKFDALLLDPPRAGAQGIAQWGKALAPHRIVYVACDPGALARDAGELAAVGLKPRTLQLFDLFPQTRHIEALMVFEA